MKISYPEKRSPKTTKNKNKDILVVVFVPQISSPVILANLVFKHIVVHDSLIAIPMIIMDE